MLNTYVFKVSTDLIFKNTKKNCSRFLYYPCIPYIYVGTYHLLLFFFSGIWHDLYVIHFLYYASRITFRLLVFFFFTSQKEKSPIRGLHTVNIYIKKKTYLYIIFLTRLLYRFQSVEHIYKYYYFFFFYILLNLAV